MNKEELELFKDNLSKLNGVESDLAIWVAASQTKVKEENSNKIVVYTGTYRRDKRAIFITHANDPKASFKQYVDIETGLIYQIPIVETKEFEEEHKVIYEEPSLENVQLYDRKYDEIRVDFFRSVLREPQEKVVLKLTKKNNQK